VTHCFTAAIMVLLLGKCCPHSPSFIGLIRWKSEGSKSRLYGGCGRTVQLRLAMCSTVFELIWDQALLCCKRKTVFISGLTREVLTLSSASTVMQWSELIVCPGSKKSGRITPFLRKKRASIYLQRAASWTFLSVGNLHLTTPQTAILTPACSGDTMSCQWSRKLWPSALNWFSRSWETCVSCSFYSCVSIHGTHMAQTLWCSSIATIISNALKPIFSFWYSSLIIICQFMWLSWLSHL